MRRVSLLLTLTAFLTLIAIGLAFFVYNYEESYGGCYVVKDKERYQNLGNGYQIIDLSAFKIKTPDRFKFISCEGIDSYVGMISDGKDTLHFDYGWYSASPSGLDPKTQLLVKDTINGKIVYITKPIQKGQGWVGVYIQQAYQDNRLSLGARNIDDEEMMFEMFASLMFYDSNPEINSKSFASDFESIEEASVNVFRQRCSACHKLVGRLIGPGLAEVDSTRFMQYFNGEILIDPIAKVDSFSMGMGQKWHQQEFKSLDSEQLLKVYEFINEDAGY